MANYTDSTTSSDVGLCRFASQDTSYMFVHEDAPIVVHNPHPMELAQDSTWHRPWNHEPKANNVAVMHGIRGWTPYDPDNRDPGYVGRRVNVAMITVSPIFIFFTKYLLRIDQKCWMPRPLLSNLAGHHFFWKSCGKNSIIKLQSSLWFGWDQCKLPPDI